MGTNYYAWRNGNNLHIGKSSGGWCFALHIMDAGETGHVPLQDITAWAMYLRTPGVVIRDEYHAVVSYDEMFDIITNRSCQQAPTWNIRTFKQNCAELGPNNLVRCVVGLGGCESHGDGTWDNIRGEFS